MQVLLAIIGSFVIIGALYVAAVQVGKFFANYSEMKKRLAKTNNIVKSEEENR